MSCYWVFSETQLEAAMQAHYQARIEAGELTPAEASLLGGAARSFLYSAEAKAMDMRRGEDVAQP